MHKSTLYRSPNAVGSEALWKRAVKSIRPFVLAPLVFLGLALSALSASGQTAGRAAVSLRVTVNVVPVIQIRSSDQIDKWILIRQTPTPSGGALLVLPMRGASLTLIEEVRKLSESSWQSELCAGSAISAERGADSGGEQVMAFSERSRSQGKVRPPARGKVEQREAVLLTRTVVSR